MAAVSVLALLNVHKEFIVKTYVSGYEVGAPLMQDYHRWPI